MTRVQLRPGVALDTVVALDTPDLGNRSYLVTDGSRAAVIDPPRDIDRVLALCARNGVELDWVLETHVHNDYVSGGLHLARTVGARYGISAGEAVDYPRAALHDGMLLDVGELRIGVHATPGHTFGHMAFSVEAEGQTTALLSGGSMLFGAVGRTDLAGQPHTMRLTELQYDSVRRLAQTMPPDAELYPTHGFGSGCAVGRVGTWTSGTVGEEMRRNPACVTDDRAEFTASLLGGLYPPPRSYGRIGPLNRRAQEPVDLTPPEVLSAAAMRDYAQRGAWVVDVRDRWLFTRGHVPGSINVPFGRGFAEWLGRVLPAEVRMALVTDSATQLREVQRALSRLGIARPLIATILDGLSATDRAVLQPQRAASFEDLAGALATGETPVIVDVRRPDEWAADHIAGALHLPLDELAADPGRVPPGEIWVHCAAGFRAGIAASILARADRRTVVVDDCWDQAPATSVPLPVVSGSSG